MKKQQIKDKISRFEQWLGANPEHQDCWLVLQDKRELERKLALEPSDEILNNG